MCDFVGRTIYGWVWLDIAHWRTALAIPAPCPVSGVPAAATRAVSLSICFVCAGAGAASRASISFSRHYIKCAIYSYNALVTHAPFSFLEGGENEALEGKVSALNTRHESWRSCRRGPRWTLQGRGCVLST